MDTRNGRILSENEIKEALAKEERRFLKKMKISPTKQQLKRKRVGRNDPCPCGSGKKFKKCCLGSIN